MLLCAYSVLVYESRRNAVLSGMPSCYDYDCIVSYTTTGTTADDNNYVLRVDAFFTCHSIFYIVFCTLAPAGGLPHRCCCSPAGALQPLLRGWQHTNRTRHPVQL